jgi:23S rRNA A2030 N6-methylase RlmJ
MTLIFVDYYGAPSNAGIYIVAEYQNTQTGDYKTGISRASLSDETNASAQNYQPTFVNPEAKPCPGDT